MKTTLGRTRVLAAIAAIVTAIGETAVVRLFTSGPSAGVDNAVLGDFTQPSGTWYDTEDHPLPTVTHGEVYKNDEGAYEVASPSVQFNFIVAEDNDAAEVRGYMVVKADGSEVYHWEYLTTPKVMATDLDSLTVEPKFAILPVVAAA